PAGRGVGLHLEVAGVARGLAEPAGEPRRRAVQVGEAERDACGGRGPRCGRRRLEPDPGHDRQPRERGEAERSRNVLQFSFARGAGIRLTTRRPTLFASVPNHMVPVSWWYIMCRMLWLTSLTEKNCSVFGSKPTSCFFGPVSEIQRRPCASLVSAYGLESGPPGIGHSLTSPVRGSIRPR